MTAIHVDGAGSSDVRISMLVRVDAIEGGSADDHSTGEPHYDVTATKRP